MVKKGVLAAVGGAFAGFFRAMGSWLRDTVMDGGGTDA